jgi:gentisate 1,2-dioxygenase
METLTERKKSGTKEESEALTQLHAEMERVHLTPTWVYAPKLVPKDPPVTYKPYLWKWDLLYRILMRAGELVAIERGGERRSMEVVNPALRDRHATTHSLGAALQLVKPGEIAPPHRHTAAAIRFIVQGRGAYTAVQGEKLFMEEGDLTA